MDRTKIDAALNLALAGAGDNTSFNVFITLQVPGSTWVKHTKDTVTKSDIDVLSRRPWIKNICLSRTSKPV